MRRLFVFALFILSAVVSAEDIGLLLGLQARGGNSSTVWVGQQGVATFARRVGDHFWLWKDEGFWHIVNEDNTRSGGRATVTVTDHQTDVRVIKGEDGRPDTDFHVMYIAPRGIGLMRRMSSRSSQTNGGFGGGSGAGGGSGGFGAGSINRVFPHAFRHHDWNDLKTAVDIDKVFKAEKVELFKKSAKVVADRQRPGYGPLDGDVALSNWTLRRDRGSWFLYGLLYSAVQTSPSTTGTSEFSIGQVDHKPLGAHLVKGPSWSRIMSEYPDVIDYTTSPDGTLTVIITPTDVFVHKSSRSSLQRRVQRVRVAAEMVVMTQWIEAKDVRKVGSAVTKIKR